MRRRLTFLATGRSFPDNTVGWLLGAVVIALVALRIPWDTSCPFWAVTGLHCPGCGGTRALLAAFQGDIVRSLSLNALALPLASLIVCFLLMFVGQQTRGWRGLSLLYRREFYWCLTLIVLVFFLLRNLHFFPVPAQ